jgi:hypothetical protein
MLTDLSKLCDEFFHDRRFTAANAACDQALAGQLSAQDRCSVLQLKARSLVGQDGRWHSPALACLRDALDLTNPETSERAKVLVAFTAAYAGLAAVDFCQDARDAFIQMYKANPSPLLERLRPHAEYNLALTYHENERLDEAETAYMFALDACQELTDDYAVELKLKIYHNLVDIFQELDRHVEAKSLMDHTFGSLSEDLYGAQIRNRKAIYALHLEDFASAILWAESGLGHRSCDDRTRAALLLTKAKIAQTQGLLEDAHDQALDAMRMAAIARSSSLSYRVAGFMNRLSREV